MQLHDEIGAVRREIELPLEREAAWELISDPRELETWLAEDVGLDAIRGGEEGTIRFGDGTERRVCVDDVEPGRRVSLCWWAPDENATLVDLTLDDTESGTRITVVELPLRTVRAAGTALVRGARQGSSPQMAVPA